MSNVFCPAAALRRRHRKSHERKFSTRCLSNRKPQRTPYCSPAANVLPMIPGCCNHPVALRFRDVYRSQLREKFVRKLIALLAVAASLSGCAAAPAYEEAPTYNSVYAYPFYGPGYGTCSILGDCDAWGGWYGYQWYGYGWRGGWHGGWHGGHGGWHGGHGGGHGGGGGFGGGGGHGGR
jgi:uncharacterized membrane protein YgcG